MFTSKWVHLQGDQMPSAPQFLVRIDIYKVVKAAIDTINDPPST